MARSPPDCMRVMFSCARQIASRPGALANVKVIVSWVRTLRLIEIARSFVQVRSRNFRSAALQNRQSGRSAPNTTRHRLRKQGQIQSKRDLPSGSRALALRADRLTACLSAPNPMAEAGWRWLKMEDRYVALACDPSLGPYGASTPKSTSIGTPHKTHLVVGRRLANPPTTRHILIALPSGSPCDRKQKGAGECNVPVGLTTRLEQSFAGAAEPFLRWLRLSACRRQTRPPLCRRRQ